jgi:hypothetical protein
MSKNTRRPIFSINTELELECLLDTGADYCVFTRGKKMLLKNFPDAELVDDVKAYITGFGYGVEIADVYKIPEIILYDAWDSNKSIKFKNVLIACCEKSISIQLILGAPLFGRLNYKIVNVDNNGKQVWIEYNRDTQYVVPVLSEEDKRILESISVFTNSNSG